MTRPKAALLLSVIISLILVVLLFHDRIRISDTAPDNAPARTSEKTGNAEPAATDKLDNSIRDGRLSNTPARYWGVVEDGK